MLVRDMIVPDWSKDTMDAFRQITPLQRAFVEWYVSGKSGAEAYRLASGQPERKGTSMECYGSNNAWNMKQVPAVNHAIDMAMRDRNFGARMDREWMLQKLKRQIEEAEESEDTTLKTSIPRLIRLVAELKGEITHKTEQEVTVKSDEAKPAIRRFMDAIRDAERRVAESN